MEKSFSLEEGMDVDDGNNFFLITWETNLSSLLVVTPPRSSRALGSHSL